MVASSVHLARIHYPNTEREVYIADLVQPGVLRGLPDGSARSSTYHPVCLVLSDIHNDRGHIVRPQSDRDLDEV